MHAGKVELCRKIWLYIHKKRDYNKTRIYNYQKGDISVYKEKENSYYSGSNRADHFFDDLFSVDAKRLGEISGYYTGVDLKKDGTETSDDDDDSDIFFYNSCYDLIINSAKIPYLDVYDSEAGNPGIGGWIIGVDDDTVTLWLNPLETDFGFAPFTGNSIIPIYKFEYELKQNKIVLSHDGKEIPFRKI